MPKMNRTISSRGVRRTKEQSTALPPFAFGERIRGVLTEQVSITTVSRRPHLVVHSRCKPKIRADGTILLRSCNLSAGFDENGDALVVEARGASRIFARLSESGQAASSLSVILLWQDEPVKLLTLVVVSILSIGALAQSDVVLWQSSTRTFIPLGGQWQCSLDEGRSWRSVILPRAECERPSRILYRKALYLDSGAAGRAWHFCFGGVRDALELTVNGQYVGRYFSGQVPFSIALPPRLLRRGRNAIELAVFPASDQSELQQQLQWRAPERPLGLVRPIVLVGSAPLFIERMIATHQAEAHLARFRVTAYVASQQSGGATNVSLRVRVLREGTTIATAEQAVMPIPDRTLPVTVELIIPDPQWWSPQSPTLYQLRVEIVANGIVVDDLWRNVAVGGLRRVGGRFKWEGADVLIPINGVVYVDQWLRREDGSLSPPNYERDVQLLRQLGVTVMYCAWLPPSPRLVELCSRAGIAIILDLPFSDTPEQYFAEEEFRTRAHNTAIRLRDAYGGEPSVVGCVLTGNVDLEKESIQQYVRAIAPVIEKANMLRFLTVPVGHTLPPGLPLDGVFVSDQILPCRDKELAGKVARTVSSLSVPWLLVGGALVQPFNRNGYADPLSIEAQAEYVGTVYRLAGMHHAAGVFIRSWSDYRTRYPILTTNLWAIALCTDGLLDTARGRRLAFEMVRALNTGEPEPLLQAGSYDAGTPYVFLAGGFGALLLLFGMMNRSRRFREYVLRSFVHTHNFFADVRDQRILLQGQTLLLAVTIAATYALVLATLLYVTRHDPAADYLSNILALTPGGKALYIQLAWSPSLAVTVVVLLILLKIVGLALLLRAIAVFTHRQVLFTDALTLVVWSLVPLILFLPVAMVLYRLLAMTPPLLWFGVLGIVTVWCIARLLRAITIVFEAAPLTVYLAGIGSLAAIAIIVLGVAQAQVAFLNYVAHFVALFFP